MRQRRPASIFGRPGGRPARRTTRKRVNKRPTLGGVDVGPIIEPKRPPRPPKRKKVTIPKSAIRPSDTDGGMLFKKPKPTRRKPNPRRARAVAQQRNTRRGRR